MTDVGDQPAGAWEIDVGFDSTVISFDSCSTLAKNTVCNPQSDETVRVVGASATGITTDTTLAALTFRCERTGVSALTLDVLGAAIPEIIFEIELREGSIECSEPGATAAPTAALPTPELPTTGMGRESAKGLDELTRVLAAAGIAAAIAAAMLRRRSPP